MQTDNSIHGVMKRRPFLLPLAIALVGLVINIIVATSMAPTTDEFVHVKYGLLILTGHSDRPDVFFDSKMPVSAFNAIPRAAGKYLESSGKAPALANVLLDIRLTRWATVAASFGLAFLVFIYAKSLFGWAAGIFAELLFIMEPNIIAHGTLSTTDLYGAAGVLLFLYCLRRFLLSPGNRNAALAAITLSLAQLLKFNAIYLYLVLALALVASVVYSRYGREHRIHISWRQAARLMALAVLCSIAVINAGFLFRRPFRSLQQYEFLSPRFRALQRIPVLRALPLPLPTPFVQGFDWMSYHDATGADYGNIVLLNQVHGPELPQSNGFRSYYLIAYLLKEPLGIQVLLVLGLVWRFRNRSPADLLAGEGLLLATAGIFVIVPSLFRSQVGIRAILPGLVIFVVLCGGAFEAWTDFSKRRKMLLVGCLLWAAVSVGSYFPHMIPYFNEIVTDRRLAYRYLADSNLDWHQDAWVVERFLKKNPDVILDPPQRVAGRVLVRGDWLAGVFPRKADYFLRVDGAKPVAQVGYAHFLFVLPRQPEARIQRTEADRR